MEEKPKGNGGNGAPNQEEQDLEDIFAVEEGAEETTESTAEGDPETEVIDEVGDAPVFSDELLENMKKDVEEAGGTFDLSSAPEGPTPAQFLPKPTTKIPPGFIVERGQALQREIRESFRLVAHHEEQVAFHMKEAETATNELLKLLDPKTAHEVLPFPDLGLAEKEKPTDPEEVVESHRLRFADDDVASDYKELLHHFDERAIDAALDAIAPVPLSQHVVTASELEQVEVRLSAE